MKVNKVKDFVTKALLATNIAIMHTGVAMCGETSLPVSGVSVNTDLSGGMTGAVSNIISVVLSFAMYIGIALGVWGGVMFGLAVKNEEPESKQKALMTLIAGIVLMGLKSLMTAIGFIGS